MQLLNNQIFNQEQLFLNRKRLLFSFIWQTPCHFDPKTAAPCDSRMGLFLLNCVNKLEKALDKTLHNKLFRATVLFRFLLFF